jgi:nicotinamidase-related amidase
MTCSRSGRARSFQVKCNLKEQLDPLGIDTPLIAGAVTNICCGESSARDAVELDYKVIMVSDALSGHAHGLHEATLATFYRIFGDVRPSGEIIDLLRTTSLHLFAADGGWAILIRRR